MQCRCWKLKYVSVTVQVQKIEIELQLLYDATAQQQLLIISVKW